MMTVFEKDKQFIANTYSRFPLFIKSGKGSVAYDESGREYIDLGSGIGVNIFGYSDPEWCGAVTKQIELLQHTSNLYYTEPCTELAELLCEKTGMDKVFFSNSGAEANECAIKAARKYSADVLGDYNATIVTVCGSFHGRTHTTLAATGQDGFHKLFVPLTSGFSYCEPTAESLLKTVKNTNAVAVMFEVIRGEGGVIPISADFAKALKSLQQKGVVLIADEVQTGNGRTGKLYGYMNYGLQPDIITTAKGLGGGLPIAATMLSAKLGKIFTPGTNGSTFGGNPVCCAGALNVIKRIDGRLLEDVKEKSEYIFEYLSDKKGINAVSGLGLMIGISTVKPAAAVAKECLKNGVLVLTAKEKVRLLPALNIPFEQLKTALGVIAEVCGKD